MNIRFGGVVIGTLAAALVMTPAQAQQDPSSARVDRLERQVEELRRELAVRDAAEVERLRQELDAVTRQIEELRLGQDVTVEADDRAYGLAPGAAKVYDVRQGVSIGGYGELLYENFADERENDAPGGARDQLDALRGIVYLGYKFNDRILFNSEIEVEHGSTDQAGSVSLEFAYLDYFLSDNFGARAGLLLVPMGFVNELHEPPTFLGTTRPLTEQVIIPTTWRESGFGFFGETAGFSGRAYLVNGLDAVGGGPSKAGGFGAGGLRGGRQKGSKALAENFAGVVRLDYVGTLGLMVGGSAYLGDSGQGALLATGEEVEARTTIVEGHAEYKAYGLDLRGLFAVANVDDVTELNIAREFAAAQSVGERLVGGYVQAGYDVLRGFETQHQLIPYVRYEQVNTQDEVPTGFAANPSTDREILSLGAAWKPIPNVILKADFQKHTNEALTGLDQFNVALGYLF